MLSLTVTTKYIVWHAVGFQMLKIVCIWANF